MAAIGDFARATANVSRIADLQQRLKVLEMLGDFARHFVAQIAAERDRAIGGNGNHKPEEEK